MLGFAGNIWDGTTDVFEGLGSFGADVVRATGEIGSGNLVGAADTIVNSVQEDLMATSLMGLFGPEGVGGTIIGALPQPVRQGAKYIIDPIFGVINYGLEELVDRPLGTGLTLVNVGLKDTGALFDLSTYAKAYSINDGRTAGQALMSLAYMIDPFDQEEFNGLQSKPVFNLFSGTVDFALEFADPTVYAGTVAVKAARGAAVVGDINSATGKITRTYGRRFANETRSSRLSLRPDLNYVFGEGLGIRRATIAGRRRQDLGRLGFLAATPSQVAQRQRIVDAFVDERAVNFTNSQRFINLNNAVQAGTTIGERARIAKTIMGRSGRHMSDRDIRRWATGETTEARALSMRVMLGDSAAHHQAIRVAHQIDDLLNTEKWAQVDNYRKSAVSTAESDGIIKERFTADSEGRITSTAPDPEIIELSKQYDKLVSSVDWSLVHHMQEALREAMPRQLVIDEATGTYRVSDAAQATLRSVDSSVTHKAIEEMLKDIGQKTADGYTKPHNVFNVPTIRGLPNGSRLNELSKFHFDRLKNSNDSMAITSMVSRNPFTDSDTVIQFVTERVPHSRIYYHDSQSTLQVERVMRDAANVVLPNGTRLIDEADALNVVERYEEARAAGNIAKSQEIFDKEITRLVAKADDMFEGWFGNQLGEEGRRGLAYERHLLDEWELAKSQATDPTAKPETIVGLTDDTKKGAVSRSLLIDQSQEGVTQIANIRLSPKQLEQFSVLPRFDLIQKNFERALRRQSDVRSDRIRAKIADVGTAGIRIGRRGTEVPMKYWRAGVLLTPKWPMRITIEEQLRMGSQLGAATVAVNLFKGIGDLRRAYGYFNFPNDKLLSDIDLLRQGMREALGDSVDASQVLKIDEALKAQVDEWGSPSKMPDDVLAERTRLQEQKAERLSTDNLSEVEMMQALGTEGFQEVVDKLIKEKVLTRRDLRRAQGNSALKAIGIGMLFANPVIGGMYGFVTYGRKTKRMAEAGQRQAATNMSSALRAEARRLMSDVAGGDAAYAAGLDLASEADLIKRLADEGNANARKAQNAFEAADDLLDKAGFGKINIGGQSFRSGFGDDPRFIEQIQREVSANNWAQSVLRGAQKSAQREMNSVSYTLSNVLDYGTRAERRKFYDDRWAETIARFSSASGTDEFFNIVWDSQRPLETRTEELANLLKNDDALADSIISDKLYYFSDEVDYNTVAEFIVKEYEGILPSDQFARFRDDIRNGKEVKWQDVERELKKGIKDNPETNLKENVKLIKEQHPQFGQVLHPETVATGNRVQTKIDGFIEDLFRMFGTLPSDELARFPFYKSVYDGELRRITAPMIDEDGFLRISQNKMNDLEREAREYATQRTREVLYDLNEQTRIGEVLGNASPFFNAWQEVLGRWGGFAVDNPMYVAKIGSLYRQPWESEFLGLTQITMGEPGQEDTYIVWRPMGDAYDEEGNRTSVFNALPDSLKDLFFPAAIRDGESPIRMSKNGFNMISQGTPGFGPLITVPVREAMLTAPELESTLGFMFPFGHPHGGFLERLGVSLAPAWAKNVQNLMTETHTREVMVARMFRDIEIQLAEAGDPLDWNDELAVMQVQEEAERRTRNFFTFRVAAGLFSPTSTTVLSPYEPLVQKYRELEREYGFKEAQLRFLDEYGPDFFALTGRMSQLNDGVRATVQNEELYRQNQELIQAHPAIGAWASGSIGPVDENYVFSQAVYNLQFNTPTSPGSDTTRRDIKTPTEYVQDTQIAQGWLEYSAMNDLIRNWQDNAENVGLSASLNANHMQRIAELKRTVVDQISEKYPAWRKDFDDFSSSSRRMNEVYDGIAAALQYENIVVRPSTPHLLEYLSLRITVQDMLKERKSRGGSDNITTNDNTDIQLFWEETKDSLGARPDFSPLYDRYFSRDRLLPDTFINAEDFPLSGMPRYA